MFHSFNEIIENETSNKSGVSVVLGDISSMMLNLSGVSSRSPPLDRAKNDTSTDKSFLCNEMQDTSNVSNGNYNTSIENKCQAHNVPEVKLTISYNSCKVS